MPQDRSAELLSIFSLSNHLVSGSFNIIHYFGSFMLSVSENILFSFRNSFYLQCFTVLYIGSAAFAAARAEFDCMVIDKSKTKTRLINRRLNQQADELNRGEKDT